MMNEVGRPSVLDDEVMCLKIKALVLDRKTNKEICEILDINYDTWQGWITRNYNGFADKMLSYKHERMLQKAEANIEVIMDNEDPKLMLDASKFVAETIGKKSYSKQVNTDLTTNGKELPQPIINVQRNNSTQEDKQPE